MSLRINTNVDAQAAHRYLTKTSDQVSKSMERLSSGLRINKAADDAAGLGISEKMRSQIRGLAQSQRNIQDGVSMVQTAEGNLDEVQGILQRVRELAVQYKNGSLSTAGKGAIQSEVDALSSEITRIQGAAQFNGIDLLSSTAAAVTFQVGANDGQSISITFAAVAVSSYATLSTLALSTIDADVDKVSAARAGFGAVQNRLEHALAVTGSYQENLTSAESRIRDVDMAEEMVNLTKNQILQQAGTAMLAQANQAPQAVLQLLR
ncbi:MAG TPA: flagellin [Solirubrobacteraceae bacterium]|jgi:flagellin|nr:flagellin [Solirubrobacteraceae bacterium]